MSATPGTQVVTVEVFKTGTSWPLALTPGVVPLTPAEASTLLTPVDLAMEVDVEVVDRIGGIEVGRSRNEGEVFAGVVDRRIAGVDAAVAGGGGRRRRVAGQADGAGRPVVEVGIGGGIAVALAGEEVGVGRADEKDLVAVGGERRYGSGAVGRSADRPGERMADQKAGAAAEIAAEEVVAVVGVGLAGQRLVELLSQITTLPSALITASSEFLLEVVVLEAAE